MHLVTIKRNDTARVLTDKLLLNGVPLDLTGTTLKFLGKSTTGDLIERAGQIVGAPVNGDVRVQLEVADVDTAGLYNVEWEVTYPDSRQLTVPSGGYGKLKILEDLG